MRIWTKSVWRWLPDGTPELVPEECESEEYSGPVSLCKDSPSPPPAPNYAAAATAQGAANSDAARTTAQLSNANYSTPLGSQTVSFGGKVFDMDAYNKAMEVQGQLGSGLVVDANTFWKDSSPQVTQSLTPAGQKLFDTNQQTQLGLGDLANQGISQVKGALGQPFNFSGPSQVSSISQGNFQGGPSPTTNGTPNVAQYTQNTNRAPGQTTSQYGQIAPTTSAGPLNPSGGNIQFGLGGAGDVSRGFADVGNNQRSLNFGGAPSMPNASFTGANDPVTQAIIQRNQPMADRQRSQMNTQLANQGIQLGSEAYKNAQDDFGRQQNDFNLGAIQSGAQEQQALFGQQLAARQQGVGEIGQQGNFANQAQGQAFQQAAERGDFGNAAQQQAFSQNLAGGQFGNQAQQQNYLQQFGNAGLNLQAQQQNFGQQVGADQQALARQQQAFGQQATGAGINLGAEQQAYGQQQGIAELGLGAQQQQYGQQAQTAQMGNQAEQARLAQQQAAASFQNQARGQSLQEQYYQRALPLNEVSALMSGSQVQIPQFQQYQGAQVAPAPIFQGAQATGQYNQGLYNAQVGQQNAQTSGLFGLGGAGLTAYGLMHAAPAAAAVSDRRLKTNVERIGTHPRLGIGVYEYDILGGHDYGVMADEVENVMPEAVVEHPFYHFKMVNYGMLNCS